jgi:hypothetical protein
MPNLLNRLFHRPAIRFGLVSDSRGKFRDPRFVSFIAESNRKTLNTDFQDAVLRGRKLLRYALVAAVVCGAAALVTAPASGWRSSRSM